MLGLGAVGAQLGDAVHDRGVVGGQGAQDAPDRAEAGGLDLGSASALTAAPASWISTGSATAVSSPINGVGR
ncbi:hypothetical protein HS99_0017760 [Kitasatospora aureofaciens]|uniref:Uncharacterized protein n=1 Tax=Kitasatospora aureofaciens TaxID=1894 RepID=A0A1E7NE34_KITAU|nr:hypothetical protein B6264_30020 [Kitasatospora aureofaciens]OEV38960.1 hypothetical protein HS99_0017760 [Kitasatospora aureofaciens]